MAMRTVPLRVSACTWNVHQTSPPDNYTFLLNLQDLELPDIIAIGLQEVETLKMKNNFIQHAVSQNEWSRSLTAALKTRNYVRVKEEYMWGLALFVFARRPELPHISKLESSYTRTGLNGYFGNKGGISIRMTIAGMSLCFVNCHLAAGMDEVGQRIDDYTRIVESQKFKTFENLSILDHDYVIWLGDLNFRLDDIPRDATLQHIAHKSYDALLEHDQLLKSMRQGLVFVDFKEGSLEFPPTYKFDSGTDQYDTSAKQRKPAWTDRILWQVYDKSLDDQMNLGISLISYKSHAEYKTSDHKPVVGKFFLKVLSPAPEPLIEFDMIEDWTHSDDGMITFSANKDMYFEVSKWDWIGLYKVDFENYGDYSTYVWSTTKTFYDTMDRKDKHQVKLEKSYIKLHSGRFCLCYHSAILKCVVGHSDPFKILVTKADDSSSSASSSEGETSSDKSNVTDSDSSASLNGVRHRFTHLEIT